MRSVIVYPGIRLLIVMPCMATSLAHVLQKAVTAEALEDTFELDVFNPPRADWIDGSDVYLRGK